MKKIDISTWKRKQHFEFFSQFEEPFFGMTWQIDMTKAKQIARGQGISLFTYYLHKSLQAAIEIENFKYRITSKGEVVIVDTINASATIMRENETFAFSYIPYHKNIEVFEKSVKEEVNRIQSSNDLFPSKNTDDVMHCSAIPWIDFTSITHARMFKGKDSVPKISYGKIMKEKGKFTMSVAVYVHHGLIDGLHLSRFKMRFQALLDGQE